MKPITTIKCKDNKNKIQEFILASDENNKIQIELITDSFAAAKNLNDTLIMFLRISEADGESDSTKLNFVTEANEKKVVITGNLYNAFLLLKSCKIIDDQTIQHLEDVDEVEISSAFDQTKNTIVQDFYDQSVKKRRDQKNLDIPSNDEVFDKAIKLEESLLQELNSLSPEKRILLLQKLAKDLESFGCKFEFNDQTSSPSSIHPTQLNP